MFVVGFFCGIVFTFICFVVAYVILRELIFKYGKPIGRMIENQLNQMESKTQEGTEIVFPNHYEEMFNKDGSTLEDNLLN